MNLKPFISAAAVLLLLAIAAASSDEEEAVVVQPYSIAGGLGLLKTLSGIFVPIIFDSKSASSVGNLLGGGMDLFMGLFGFFDKGQSQLEKQMLEQFAQVHRKLDEIHNSVVSLAELSKWQFELARFRDYQSKVLAISNELHDYMKGRSSRAVYINECRRRTIPAREIYDGIVNSASGANQNLGVAIAQYTKFDKKKSMKFLLDMTRIIMRGTEADVACLRVEGKKQAAADRAKQWKGLMQTLANKLNSIDKMIYDQRAHQWRKDVDQLIAGQSGKSNQEFVKIVCNWLSNKYYWHHWFVLRHNKIGINRNNWFYQGSVYSGAAHYAAHGDKIVVVAHQNPKNTLFDKGRTDGILAQVDSEVRKNEANQYLASMNRRIGTSSQNSIVRYAVHVNSRDHNYDVRHWSAPANRVSVRRTTPSIDWGDWTCNNCGSYLYVFG